MLGNTAQDLVFQVARNRDSTGQVVRSIQPGTQVLASPVNANLPPLQGTNLQLLYETCEFSIWNPLCLLGGIVNSTVQLVLSAVGGAVNLLNAALAALSGNVLQPLLNSLGISLGYSDVTLTDVQVSTPRLVR
ncbi:hypothetical protein D9M70_589470 [compost metagenome]